MKLTKHRLKEIIQEELADLRIESLEEGRFSDVLRRFFGGGAGGRVTRGGSQGERAQDAAALGVDASETPAEAEAALAAETPYGPEHSIYTATPSARGRGRVTAGGPGGVRAKAAARLGVDPSQDPADVDPHAFPGAPGEEPPADGRPGKPRRGHRGRGEPDKHGNQLIGQSAYFSGPYRNRKESLTRSRLRQIVREEAAALRAEGKKASKSVGDPPYRERGSTESQAQQKAAGMALSARRGDTPVSKLKGAALDLYNGEITTKELRNLAKLGQKVKKHKAKEPKHLKSLPGHVTPAKN